MTRISNSILSYGAVALAAGALTLALPQAAHAVAAALVQVTNTAANPVINQNVDSPGRSPYVQSAACSSSSSNTCFATFPAVPANKRLVVQYIASSVNTPTPLLVADFVPPGGNVPVVHTLQSTDGQGNYYYVASQPCLYFLEAGQQPLFNMSAQAGGVESLNGNVTVTGYLVDLTE